MSTVLNRRDGLNHRDDLSRHDERSARRKGRMARRVELSGAGPVREEREPARFPGAGAKFALFGEVLMVGLLVTLVGALVVTLPVGLAAGVRHMRRYVNAEDSGLRHFWRDVRDGLAGGILLGLAVVALVLVLTLDIAVATSGLLPGGPVFAVIGWVALAAGAVALLAAAGQWSPERGWVAALRAVPRLVAGDVAGALYLAATAVFVVVTTWALAPLIVPALGCAVLAVVAIPHRGGRDQA